MPFAPDRRVQVRNAHPPQPEREFVLYWMTANRRVRANFALEHAAAWAENLRRPLLVLEALRSGYPYASDRLHAFIVQGMADQRREFEDRSARYYAYVEPEPGAGRGLLGALAERACLVVGDDWPCFFHPGMHAAAARRIHARLELVDANGIVPIRAAHKAFARAYDFRRYLQRVFVEATAEWPQIDPLRSADLPPAPAIPREILDRWPEARPKLLEGGVSELAALPIDHQVRPGGERGGSAAGHRRLERFLSERLGHYHEGRNDPDEDQASGLSPWLHFGQVGAHEVFSRVAERECWSLEDLGEERSGKRQGFYGMGPGAEAFLDQLVTWRELGFNGCAQLGEYDGYGAVPGWARQTLDEHRGDRREFVYTLEQFSGSATHDRLWNAAQSQLRETGRLHNYLRMLWGKKILHWSESPEEALDIMIALNDRFALDGRDPNSYSGMTWILGHYDRPWGPERPVFGKVRYMSSGSAQRKLRLGRYLERFS